ncbi:hypothetical protein, partial [Enterococcus casseliflavus]|uniref:hypothetical protein n=1 Tax=Enterococcus casseliflavus TaxID=37734 RepID=UPI003D0A7D25
YFLRKRRFHYKGEHAKKSTKRAKNRIIMTQFSIKTGRKNLNNSKNKEIGKFIDSGINTDLSKRL